MTLAVDSSGLWQVAFSVAWLIVTASALFIDVRCCILVAQCMQDASAREAGERAAGFEEAEQRQVALAQQASEELEGCRRSLEAELVSEREALRRAEDLTAPRSPCAVKMRPLL